ncbi:phosphotransferase, partial [Candidatus Halobonum tyrrellensis G22]
MDGNADADAPADDRVSAAVAAAFPDRAVAALGATGPSWNDDNRTVSVEFADGGAAYLKAVVAGDGSAVARERAALD